MSAPTVSNYYRERTAATLAAAAEAAKAPDAAAPPPAAAPVAAAAEPAATTETPSGEKGAVVFKAVGVSGDHTVIQAIASAAEIYDRDDDTMHEHDLVALAHDFCANKGRVLKANHTEELPKAELVESLVGAAILKSGRVMVKGEALPPQNDADPRIAAGESIDPVVGVTLKGHPQHANLHWFVGIRPNDAAVVEKAESGGIAGLSWSGSANRTPEE